jgi:hypothetical protein
VAYNLLVDFMLNTAWAVVHEERIETLDAVGAPEGTRALVILLVADDANFWQTIV